MWKKTGSVTAILCAALLVGCNTDDEAVPSTNETPMEDVQEDTERLVPDVNTPSPNNGTNEGIYDNDTNQNLDDNINNNTDPKVNEDENLNPDNDKESNNLVSLNATKKMIDVLKEAHIMTFFNFKASEETSFSKLTKAERKLV